MRMGGWGGGGKMEINFCRYPIDVKRIYFSAQMLIFALVGIEFSKLCFLDKKYTTACTIPTSINSESV